MATDDYCVYILTCTVTGLQYVGKTNDLDRRIAEHIYDANTDDPAKIHKAINEHGWDNFDCSVYKSNLSHTQAMELESKMIHELDTCDGPGYNMTHGGDNDS